MTRDDYRRAAGSFEPDASLKQRIASALEQPPRRSVRPLRRALVGTLAAVLALPYAAGIAPYLSLRDEECGRANSGWRRFIWLNLVTGFLLTQLLIWIALTR